MDKNSIVLCQITILGESKWSLTLAPSSGASDLITNFAIKMLSRRFAQGTFVAGATSGWNYPIFMNVGGFLSGIVVPSDGSKCYPLIYDEHDDVLKAGAYSLTNGARYIFYIF